MKKLTFPLHFETPIRTALVSLQMNGQYLAGTLTNDGVRVAFTLDHAPRHDRDIQALVQFGVYIGTELAKPENNPY